MKPGETIPGEGNIVLNEGRDSIVLSIKNENDRPIQVGSHYHFFEVNKGLSFDRAAAFGYRLDIPAGNAVRFEPGEEKEVSLVMIGGNKRMVGFNNLVDGEINEENKTKALEKAKELGYN